ncbi:hypothetical protein GJ744_002456 [Endocarpon pusillum]|uniref:GPI inositol-deacylase winged helix domain-containing protein n=1 Tax=Endocarpon pusillum TaxID=364733 RepID=A0A8H7ABZ5_9EURO|nr:hypothetical protein GJ744_002456 [Endocarpon pusillum]
MYQLPDFVEGDNTLQNEIMTEIEAAIEGIFLLARLYLDSLVGKRSVAALRKALKGLRKVSTASSNGTSALDEAYEKAMERIQYQKGDMPRDAILILSWVVNARRQMTVRELQEALAVEIGKLALDKDNIPTVEHITQACAPLVVIDEESNIIRLIHYTTQEFLERRQNLWFKSAQAYITRITVTYLAFTLFESGACPSMTEWDDRTGTHKLYRYAAENWGHHAHKALTQGMEAQELVEFLESDQKREAASQLIMASRESDVSGGPRHVTALHLAGYFGLYEVMVLLLKKGHSPSAEDTHKHTPLWWAARRGHLSVVELLLERGVRSDMECYPDEQTSLWWAATNGYAPIVELLLTKNVYLESRGKTNLILRLLASAVENGHTAVVKLLLENGAHPESSCRCCQFNQSWPYICWRCGFAWQKTTLLMSASRNGYQDILRLLLAEKVNVEAKDDRGLTSLAWVARNGYQEAVRLLLANKANVEGKDDNALTPLTWAARNGHYAVTNLLLKHKADVNAQDNTGTTILHWVASRGHEEVVSLLLQHGANIETRNAGGGTALAAAVEGGFDAVVKLLLARKVKVNYRYYLFKMRIVGRSCNHVFGDVKYIVPTDTSGGLLNLSRTKETDITLFSRRSMLNGSNVDSRRSMLNGSNIDKSARCGGLLRKSTLKW